MTRWKEHEKLNKWCEPTQLGEMNVNIYQKAMLINMAIMLVTAHADFHLLNNSMIDHYIIKWFIYVWMIATGLSALILLSIGMFK